jgi:hypothetical protein
VQEEKAFSAGERHDFNDFLVGALEEFKEEFAEACFFLDEAKLLADLEKHFNSCTFN